MPCGLPMLCEAPAMRKTPFFIRQMELTESMAWKAWSGYTAPESYVLHQEAEYSAIRAAAGLLDITPLFKYRVRGPDSASFLSQIMVRDVARLGVGKSCYLCWCTDDGKVIDDGMVMRRGETEFFVTTADPAFAWFSRFLRGHRVSLEDITERVAALALQGPASRAILAEVCDAGALRFFETAPMHLAGVPAWVSRTGYTGDLGYEIWMDAEHALTVWDALMSAGAHYALRPAGLGALDICRIEAGLILKNVEYYNALHALIDSRRSSPYEISLGWTVELDRAPFNGQRALRQEKRRGSSWALVGLDLDWQETERLFARHGLPPNVGRTASRQSVPVYRNPDRQRQVGYITSATWSPTLQKHVAIASVQAPFAIPGSRLQCEMVVEHIPCSVTASVCKPPFYRPPHKTSNPGEDRT